MTDRPSSAELLVAIGKVAAGDWIDPATAPIHWDCQLYDSNDYWAGEGCGHTAAEAMALAWLHAWAPDALIKGRAEPGEVQFEIPDTWRFDLTPPWRISLRY
jgi:hypothetical protein